MKKYAILTSVLALTACAGGSGGGSAGGALSPEESNLAVTGMRTSVEIDKNGHSVNVRSAVTPRNSAVGYTELSNGNKIYDLRNVKFTFGDEQFGKDSLTFDVDSDKKITKFIIAEEHGGKRTFNRIGDTNTFEGKVDVGTEEDGVLTYNSMGKDLGLQYSDFGNFDVKVGGVGISDWAVPFAGGYDVKKIDAENISDNATFEGRATGYAAKVTGNVDEAVMVPLDSDAKLEFDGATHTSTLTANFDNWYDVKYTESGTTKEIEFSNYVGNGPQFDKTTYNLDDINTNEKPKIESDIHYYGDDGIPTEVTGVIQLRECSGDCGDSPEVRMNLGFGAK